MNNQIQAQRPKFSAMISTPGYQKMINNTLQDPKRAQRFVAAITSAVATNPALQECDPPTILSGALLGESLGLSPSPQLGQYYLVPYWNKKKQCNDAQFQLGYKGYVQLALRSGYYKHLRVGHQLQTVVQRAVVLDVEEFLLVVGDPEKGTGIVPVLTAAVDLQLHAKKPGPISIEDRLRFVVVIVDGLVPEEGLEAVGTVGTVAVLVDLLIAGGVDPDELPAAAAAGEVFIVAILAERGIPGT